MCVCQSVGVDLSVHKHTYVYACLSEKALFLGVCGVSVFYFKAQQNET